MKVAGEVILCSGWKCK